jgi:hypothetical protein
MIESVGESSFRDPDTRGCAVKLLEGNGTESSGHCTPVFDQAFDRSLA